MSIPRKINIPPVIGSLILIILAVIKPIYGWILLSEINKTDHNTLFIFIASLDYLLSIGLLAYAAAELPRKIGPHATAFAIIELIYRIYIMDNLIFPEFIQFWDLGWLYYQAPSILFLGVTLMLIGETSSENDTKFSVQIIDPKFVRKLIDQSGWIALIISFVIVLGIVFPPVAYIFFIGYHILYSLMISIILLSIVKHVLKRDLVDYTITNVAG